MLSGGLTARQLALHVLVRVDVEGAYANVALPKALASSGLHERDRAFATELVYGVTRRRRALDWVLDEFLKRPPPPQARAALRLGAYQMLELRTPAHAAVSATVAVTPNKFKRLVNAVLRRVAVTAAALDGQVQWPDEATRLSYPDWIVETLTTDLGADSAIKALEAMNDRAVTHRRADGYVQDLSSQLVVDSMRLSAGDRVADLCAAPGGKATAMAAKGAYVAALDSHRGRARLMETNRAALGSPSMSVIVGDARTPPLRRGGFDAVLVDAPCSGLGALKRRPDARWRIRREAVDRLAGLQVELLQAAVEMLAPGGLLVYSVCTLTAAETIGVAEKVSDDDRLRPERISRGATTGSSQLGDDCEMPETLGWRPHGTGGIILPGPAHDGMSMFTWRLTATV